VRLNSLVRLIFFLVGALTGALIFVDRFRAKVGVVSEVEPQFGVESREVRSCTQFALRSDFEGVSRGKRPLYGDCGPRKNA
jgi:hypothetical protein